jgi:hypothetical protein
VLLELSDSDWQQLLDATPGTMHPWLAYCIERRFAPEQLPRSVSGALTEARRGAAVGHLRRQAVLRLLLPALESAGVTAVVLKGGALAHFAYPEPALRPMDDLDLWVRPGDLDKAVAAAGEAGLHYSSRYRDRTAAQRQESRVATRVLEHRQSNLAVEIHGALNSLRELSPAWHQRAWERRERRRLGDMQAWVMHPEDMLTHLALHCGRNDYFRAGLRPILDVALLLGSDGSRIDWNRLLGDWDRERMAVWALLPVSIARDLLEAPVPAAVEEQIARMPGFDELRAAAAEQVYGAVHRLPPMVTYLVNSTPRERAAWIYTRFISWYWKGAPGVHRSAMQVLRDAGRRMAHDLRHRTGRYLQGLLGGQFWGGEFRRRRQVALGRKRLEDLVENVEDRRRSPPRH